jgi:prolipoprotein diacylglyceryltransferase
MVIFLLLYLTDRRLGDRRSAGLMVGILCICYFGLRFFVEFSKEYQVISSSFPMTMGQLLSIPFAIAGCIIVATRYRAILGALKESKGA